MTTSLVQPDAKGHMHFDSPELGSGQWEEVERYSATNLLGLSRVERVRRYHGAVLKDPEEVLEEPLMSGWTWRGWGKPAREITISKGTWTRGRS